MRRLGGEGSVHPRFVRELEGPEALGCEVVRLVINTLVINTAQQDQVVLGVELPLAVARSRTSGTACGNVALISDDRGRVIGSLLGYERAPADRASVARAAP